VRSAVTPAVVVRDRSAADLPACVALAEQVHGSDGYPAYLPGDMEGFLASEHALGAWVAEVAGSVAGHVALHRRAAPGVMELARAATGLSDDGLAVVARLLVAPAARRVGAGRALLRHAAREAAARGRRPLLDVMHEYAAAVALYEAEGWQPIGSVTLVLAGNVLRERVYLGPPAQQAG
jgi:ribosomal protein S18 acetylase RimI-like enzyme